VQNFNILAKTIHDTNLPLLTEEQKIIYDTITYDIENQRGRVYSLDAAGGCGKTFTCNTLLSSVRKDGHTALAMAMTGIAALLLRLGMTFHRGTGCPVPCHEDSTSKFTLQSREADRLRKAKLIVIDEVSMQHKNQYNMLDRFLKSLMDSNELMGGKVILLMHDWRQQLPIIPNQPRGNIIAACIFNSPSWKHVHKLKLYKNMRVQRLLNDSNADPEYINRLEGHAQWLLKLGDGTLDTFGSTNLIEIPAHQVCQIERENYRISNK